MAVEKELKYKITAATYRQLIAILKASQSIQGIHLQKNTFFDTPDRALLAAGCVLRLRVENRSTAYLTLKGSKSGAGKIRGFSARKEWESKISMARATRILKTPASVLGLGNEPVRRLKQAFKKSELSSLNQLKVLGSFSTHRTKADIGLPLEVDQFRVGTKTYYEIEVETTQPARTARRLGVFLEVFRLRAIPESRSKFQRFKASLRKK